MVQAGGGGSPARHQGSGLSTQPLVQAAGRTGSVGVLVSLLKGEARVLRGRMGKRRCRAAERREGVSCGLREGDTTLGGYGRVERVTQAPLGFHYHEFPGCRGCDCLLFSKAGGVDLTRVVVSSEGPWSRGREQGVKPE